MKFTFAALFITLHCIFGFVGAFQITNPSPSKWWVYDELNLLAWTCNDDPPDLQYTVVVFGPGALQAGLPLIGTLNNADCSETIGADSALPAGAGYSLVFTSVTDRSTVYATSNFSILATDVYPGSVVPSTSSTSISSGSSGSSGTSSSSSPTSTKTSAAFQLEASYALVSGVAMMIGALMF